MSNNKMKGLLKGLRYISHIFENEKEPEMQIGFPTDVKHVAHIGWDGPSVNSPSWMNEFQSPPGFSSAPLSLGGESKDDSSLKWASEDSTRRSVRGSSARDLPELPKSSRRHAPTGSSAESPTGEKSEKTKQSRRASKNSNKDLMDTSKSNDSSQGAESPTKRPDIPKKSRRKKSKDSAEGSSRSSRSSRITHGSKSDSVSECGSVSKANNYELCQTSGFNSSEGGEEKEYTEIY